MEHSITKRIDAVRRSARRIVWWWSACLLIASLIAVALVFTLIDWLLRHQDTGMRYLIFAAIIAIISGVLYRVWRSLAESRLSRLEVARIIERNSDDLGDKLSSSIDFLSQSHGPVTAGGQSTAMQRAVIEETAKKLDRMNPRALLDYRSTIRIAFLTGGAIAILMTVCLFNASALKTGLQRVFAPWSNVEWPRRNDLYFANRVEQMALGTDFVATLRDHNDHLPDNVSFEFEYLDAEDTTRQNRLMNRIEDSMVVRLENVTRGFRYRAIGGDDETRWFSMHVLPAPELDDIEFIVTPPAYSKLAEHRFHDNVRAIAGSTLKIRAVAAVPLIDADMRWDFDGKKQWNRPALIEDDRLSIQYPVPGEQEVIEKSARLEVLIQDEQQVTGGNERSYEIVVVEDRAPAILLAANTSTSVTPRGSAGLRVTVNEDVRLKSVALFYSVNRTKDAERDLGQLVDKRLDQAGKGETAGNADLHELNLYPKSDSELVRTEIAPVGDFGFGETFRADIAFSLETFLPASSLEPGDQVSILAMATDMKGHAQKSSELKIRISSASELLQTLLDKQNRVFEQLAAALKIQRAAASQFETIQSKIETGDLKAAPEVAQRLEPIRASQRQVALRLSSENDGAGAMLLEIIRLGQNNLSEHKSFLSHIETILAEVDSITAGPLEDADFQLSELNRVATAQNGTLDDTQKELLSPVYNSQQKVISRLEKLVGEFSHVDSFRNSISDWLEIRRRQNELNLETRRLQNETAGRESNRLSKQLRDQLEDLQGRQNDLAREAQQAAWDLQQLAESMDSALPGYDSVLAATNLARELRIDETMRQVVSNLAANQMGNAAENQKKSITALDRLIEALQGDVNERERNRLESAEKARAEVEELIGAQREISDMLANETSDESLQQAANSQKSVIDRLNELRDNLQRSRNGDAAKKANAAIDEATKTSERIAEQDRNNATESSRDTEQRLDELRANVDQDVKREQSRQNQARDNEAILVLEELIALQASLISRFDKFVLDFKPNDLATDAERRAIVEGEQELAEAANSLNEQFTDQPAISFSISQAARELTLAAEKVDAKRELEEESFSSAKRNMLSALETLKLIRSAFNNRDKPNDSNRSTPPEGDQPNEEGEGLPQIGAVELTLLIESQKAILLRTTELETTRAERSGELTKAESSELEQLRQRESMLIEIVEQYISRLNSVGNDVPDDGKSIPNVPLPGLPGLE